MKNSSVNKVARYEFCCASFILLESIIYYMGRGYFHSLIVQMQMTYLTTLCYSFYTNLNKIIYMLYRKLSKLQMIES